MTPPIGPIGDMGVANLTEQAGAETITWETATDWDNAAAELGVVHEDTADTVYGDASIIQKGLSAANPYKASDLRTLHLFQEASGTSTIVDHSGNVNDGQYAAIDGGTGDIGYRAGGPGAMSSARHNAGGSPDVISQAGGANANNSDGTWAILFYEHNEISGSNNPHHTREGADFLIEDSGGPVWTRMSGTDYKNGSMPFQQWTLHLTTTDGSSAAQYRDDNQIATFTDSWGDIDSTCGICGSDTGGEHCDDRMAMWAFWDGMWTQQEVTDFWNIFNGTSYLETASKTFSSARTPDFENLDYSLNGNTLTLKAIGSPGTASEEVVSQVLDGSTSYTLTWSDSHTDFRIRPELQNDGGIETTPTFRAGSLTG